MMGEQLLLLVEHLANPGPTLRGHLAICRVDHWFKNVFVLPGIVAAIGMDRRLTWDLLARLLLGLLAIGLVASSNYVINEVLDAPFDRTIPSSAPPGAVGTGSRGPRLRAVARRGGRAWDRHAVSNHFALVLVALWLMGCVYNIRPVRTKDVPYLDVLSESVNNPLRMLAGWFIVAPMPFRPRRCC